MYQSVSIASASKHIQFGYWMETSVDLSNCLTIYLNINSSSIIDLKVIKLVFTFVKILNAAGWVSCILVSIM